MGFVATSGKPASSTKYIMTKQRAYHIYDLFKILDVLVWSLQGLHVDNG